MSKIAVIGLAGNSAFMSVDSFHKSGETVHAKQIHFEPGGKGFNQAVAAARFGAEVSFLGAVGSEYNREIEEFLIKDNIKPYLVKKNDSTAFATILTDANGANQVTVYAGACLEANDVNAFEAEIEKADILLLNNEVPLEVNEKAIAAAKKSGTMVVYNPAPSKKLSDYIIKNVDMFTPNEHEISGLEHLSNVIITLGSKGCLIKSTGEQISAAKIDKVVDTTGAGDTFNGVLACELADGKELEKAVKHAVMASGVSVTQRFAATSVPTRKQVFDYFNK